MFDTIMDLLQNLVLPALVAGVVSVMFHRYNESRRARTDDCRKLRDLVAELHLTQMRIGNPPTFDFRPLSVRRWDDAPQDIVRSEDSSVYDVLVTAYDIIDKVNMDSAEVRRRGQVRQPDEDAAKRDVRRSIQHDGRWIIQAHSDLKKYVSERCG